MKSLDEIVGNIIKRVREIDSSCPISDGDIACIAGIVMSEMYKEDIDNALNKEPVNSAQQTVTGSQETLTQIAENLEAIAKTVGMYMHKEDENELNDYARQLRLL